MTGYEAMGLNWNNIHIYIYICENQSEHKKTFCIVRVVKNRDKLPREVVESLSLEELKTQLDIVLGN